MAPIVWSDVTAHASTLTTVDPVQQADLLALVNGGLSHVFDGEDGPKTKLARIYFAAHFAAPLGAGEQRAAGPVVSESRGGLSRAYQAISAGGGADSDTWSDTQWGRRYLQLLLGSKARWPRTP